MFEFYSEAPRDNKKSYMRRARGSIRDKANFCEEGRLIRFQCVGSGCSKVLFCFHVEVVAWAALATERKRTGAPIEYAQQVGVELAPTQTIETVASEDDAFTTSATLQAMSGLGLTKG